MTKTYKPEINGLRAVAVLLVLIFHIDSNLLQGGFLGVDVFFVISGYLITNNILFDIKQEAFSFADFYRRRVQRLLPALGFTILATIIAGYFFLPSYFYERLSNSALLALLSASNIFFWLEGGYFNTGSDLKPLLHTWSLGIEEQFYLLWPILIVGLQKFLPKFLNLVFLLLVALSIALCHLYMHSDPPAATFFLLQFRIFEFVLGAVCISLVPFFKEKQILNNVLVIIGLGLIIGSAVVFDQYMTMPGMLSLIPCVGTMLVICGGLSSLSSILLNNKLADLIGKASYSIYLFHWPLIVYYNLWTVEDDLLLGEKFLLLGLSLVGGFLMWGLIEQPMRRPAIKARTIWLGVPVFFLSIAGIAYGIRFNKGFPQRDNNPYTLNEKQLNQQKGKYWREGGPESAILKGSSNKQVLIMGNSHAIDLIYSLRNNGFRANIISLPTHFSCSNFGALPIEKKYTTKCESVTNRNLANIAWQRADEIYLHDDWRAQNNQNLRLLLERIRTLTNAPIYVFGPKMIYTQVSDVIIKSSKSISPKEINKHALSYALVERRKRQSAATATLLLSLIHI